MGRHTDTVIPLRFLATVGNFIVFTLTYDHKDANIAASGDPSASGIALATTSFNAVFGLGMACFAIQAMGLFGGYTTFNDQ